MQITPTDSSELGNFEYERVAPHVHRFLDRVNHETRVLFTEDDGEDAILIRKPWGFDLEECICGLLPGR